MTSRLDDELLRLVGAGVLRSYQADALRAAAEADAATTQRAESVGRVPLGRPAEPPAQKVQKAPKTPKARKAPKEPRDKPVRRFAGAHVDRSRGSFLMELLGYIGGVLLLGAVGLLTLANWSVMGHGERITTSVLATVVLLGAAVLLLIVRGPQQPASALAALGACASGFATSVISAGTPGRVAGVLVALAVAGLGLWLLQGTALLAATFAILAVGVFVVVFDVIDATGGRTDTAGMAGAGFVVVAVVLAGLGLVRDRVTAWSLTGAAAFSSSMCWLVQDRGELMALAVGTAGTAALLIAHARCQAPAYVVVGCSILLVVWPTGLYRLTENVAGVAIGLLVASSALIAAVIVLSRRQRGTPDRIPV